MQMAITGRGIDITDTLKQLIEKKLSKVFHHLEPINQVNVILTVENFRQIAEATAHVKLGDIHASAEAKDMYEAIDLLAGKLDRQLIKHKEKLKKHRE